MFTSWTFKSILLLVLVAGVKLSPQYKKGKDSSASNNIVKREASSSEPHTASSETNIDVRNAEAKSYCQDETLVNLRKEVNRLRSLMENLEAEMKTISPIKIHGLEEEINYASTSNDWTKCIELLERNLCESSIEYKQLQKIKDLNSLVWVGAENGYTELLSVLISNGLSVNKGFEAANNTMLHIAASNGRSKLVTYLIDNGADLEVKNTWGWTAVHHATVTGQLDVLKILVKRGADVNVKNTSIGFTPLHYAAFFGRATVVHYLISSTNCDRSVRSNSGERAQDIAKKGYNTIVKLLSQ